MDIYLTAYAGSLLMQASTPARTPAAEDAFYQQYGHRPRVLDWLSALVDAARHTRTTLQHFHTADA